MRKKMMICMVLAGLILFAACSPDEEQAADNDATGNGEKGEQDTYPLTGMPADGHVDDRIVSVMINNHPKARPQSGLSQADIVFEILAEGDITRFLALFQSEKPETVGPVRSAREYYFELAKGYGALYIYHGAANFVNDMIADRGIEHLDGALHDNDGVLFKRSTARKAPHNSYLQYATVNEEAEAKGYKMEQNVDSLPFIGKGEKITGDDAAEVAINYGESGRNIVEYHYDKADETYRRLSDQEETVDSSTEQPVQAANVFIIEADHQVIDEEGRRAIDLESGGKAYLIQKGTVQQVQWENKQGRIIPVKNGKTIGFVPGQTWINVVPADPGIQQSVNMK